MTVERYIREYANAKRKAYENNSLINSGIRAELLRRIDRALKMREKCFITADEAMKIIGNFTDKNEDFSQYAI